MHLAKRRCQSVDGGVVCCCLLSSETVTFLTWVRWCCHWCSFKVCIFFLATNPFCFCDFLPSPSPSPCRLPSHPHTLPHIPTPTHTHIHAKHTPCLQDEKYWNRRVKNNEAAKRSRDARRLKENQISVRAAFLERENAALRQEVADMRKELGRCRNILSKYESRHGDL